MNALIPVSERLIGAHPVPSVDARELHGFLEVGKDFSSWIKGRIEQYGFVEHHDFVTFDAAPQNGGAGNRGHRTDYALTLDMAKELAMVERNERGRQARRYFIECERRLWAALADTPPSPRPPSRIVDLERASRLLARTAGESDPAIRAQLAVYLQAMHTDLGLPPPDLPASATPATASAAPTARPEPAWRWLVQTLLDEVAAGRYPGPHADEQLDQQRVLLFRATDLVAHVKASPTLAPIWQQQGSLSPHALKQTLLAQGLLVRPRLERTLHGQRHGHLQALALDRLASMP